MITENVYCTNRIDLAGCTLVIENKDYFIVTGRAEVYYREELYYSVSNYINQPVVRSKPYLYEIRFQANVDKHIKVKVWSPIASLKINNKIIPVRIDNIKNNLNTSTFVEGYIHPDNVVDIWAVQIKKIIKRGLA